MDENQALMDNLVIAQLLMRRRKPQTDIGEILRATGMGMAGRAAEYQPVKQPEQDTGVQDYLIKALLQRQIEGTPIEKYKAEQEVKQQMEAKDPYRQSQLGLNNAMLESIKNQGGGDLVYRNQMTGIEVPPLQAIQDIQQGKQYIIKRRVTTRQGIKEEDVSKPKELTEAEVKTSTGAEEVLKEIDDLEKIIKAEPAGKKSLIPFFGTSAQAQGVKIPLIAPYGISQKGQEYRTLRESINNRLLYLRSGAQINDKEYQRLSGMLPEIFRADAVDLQQLARFKSEFGNILQRINSGRRGVMQTGQVEQPLNPQDALAELKRRGKI